MIFNKDNVKSNFFHFYALKGEWQTYKLIKEDNIDEYPNLLTVFDDLGYSPLFYAFLGGNKNIIQDMLKYNNLYLTYNDKIKEIPWFKNDKILSFIFYSQNIDVFKLYLSYININTILPPMVIYYIITQIKENLSKKYYDLFIDFLKDNLVPLHIDPSSFNEKGESLLYYTILYNQKYIFNKLLSIHLEMNMNKAENPFMFLGFSLPYYTLSEKFRFNKNRVFFIHSLIYKYGINFINKPHKNNNNLTNIAIEIFDEELLRLLISCGVNTLEKNNIGNTCLHTCVKSGSLYAYKILVDFFSYSTLNIKNDKNETIYDNANIFYKDILSSRFTELVKYKEKKLI